MAVNTIHTTVEALVQGPMQIWSSGAVTVSATDNSTDKAVTIAISLTLATSQDTSAAFAGSGSIATNTIGNTVTGVDHRRAGDTPAPAASR